jgi:hypothetical protein
MSKAMELLLSGITAARLLWVYDLSLQRAVA